MTTIRCSYMPPEGEAAISSAVERGRATPGDLRRLADRFGCSTAARWTVCDVEDLAEGAHACADHVGQLLGDRVNIVVPVDAPTHPCELTTRSR